MKCTSVIHLVAVAACLAAACTNVIVTPGATSDGSSFITYNADSTRRFGFLHFLPHAKWPANSTVDVVNYETGDIIGKIEQVPETYNVVGLMNEYQVSIGETTFGGLAELQHQTGAVVDYGSLMYFALQRSKTAREAIRVMDQLVQRYGYYSEGESFSVADAKESWILEMIGKGDYELGAVWVARRVPDGYVCAHANQARITTFPKSDPDNCMYSPDVVTFAQAHGYYPKHGSFEDFSFSDVYSPMSFTAARACEARVWSIFRHVAGSDAMDKYLNYALGYNLTNRMPLWVKPTLKLTLNDTMSLMRDHYEGTPLQDTADIGSAPFDTPYRWHPLQWKYAGKSYIHERPIATQQTGYGFVAQSRSWMPRQVGAIFWFAVDDTGCSVYYPVYASSSRISTEYNSNGNIMTFSLRNAFWVFNMVANFAYTRWNAIYPEVFDRIQQYEAWFMKEVSEVDAKALKLVSVSTESAVEFLTAYSELAGTKLVQDWWDFFGKLFVRHVDGVLKEKGPTVGRPVITQPGYSQEWYGRIVEEAGDRYHVPEETSTSVKRVHSANL